MGYSLPPWVGIPFGVTKLPGSFIDVPHSLAPVFGQIDLLGALNIAFLPFLFVFCVRVFLDHGFDAGGRRRGGLTG